MRISIVVPTHDMKDGDWFLQRLITSLDQQHFRDFELVITKEGKMAANTNAGIKKAKGEIIKILYMDDFLYNPYALDNISQNFTGGWLATGCIHSSEGHLFNEHVPTYSEDIRTGNNTIGSPSVVAFENNDPLLFDEKMSWLLDCDLYHRLHERYGLPTLLETIDIGIGVGRHQTSYLMSDREKLEEHNYIKQKYGTTN